MIPVWVPVVAPWAGAALLAALPRRPVLARSAVAVASLLAALALVLWGGAGRPDAFGSALLLAGAVSALLAALADAGGETLRGAPNRDDRVHAAGFPLLQGAQALALLAGDDAAVGWVGLAVGVGAGVALVARSGGGNGRRAFAVAWRMLLLCGAGLALALLGVVLSAQGGRAPGASSGLSALGFALLLVGYGALAGLAPMHAWVPRAVAVSPPPVAAVVAGLLPPAALHALVRAAAAASAGAAPSGGLPRPAAFLAAVGLATTLVAAFAAWRGRRTGAAVGWGVVGLLGLAAVGFGLGGAAGSLAGVLLLLGLPFCVGAAVLGAAAGGPVAALGRVSLAGMPPFAPFVGLVLLFSAVAALPAAVALPLGSAVLLAAAAQLGTAAGPGRGGASAGRRAGSSGGPLVSVPPWVLLGLALALGAALPEPVAAVLAEAARLAR